MKTPGVYLIRNHITGALYVGHAANTEQRFRQHRHRLRRGTHANRHLQNAWNKYGEHAFTFRRIATIEDLGARCAAEVDVIARLLAKGRRVYNIGEGGEGQPHTAESRARISAGHKGKTVSVETRRRMSESLRGIPCHPNTRSATSGYWKGRKRGPMSAETKRKVSDAKKGKVAHQWTEQSRKKVSQSLRGRTVSDATRQRMREARSKALARGQRSRVVMITHDGKTMSVKDWAALIGIDPRLLGYRLKHWSVAEAITTPVDTSKRAKKTQ